MMGGKKIKGRKREFATDTKGNLHETAVHAADIPDCEGGILVLEKIAIRQKAGEYPRLACTMTDHAYDRGDFPDYVERELGCRIEIAVKDPHQHTFIPYPLRWVVEAAIAWLGRCRRLSKDYEYVNACSEAHIYIASIQRLLKKVA
jgi:putative transposase